MTSQRIFLDANIFIAATASSRGGSRLLFELAKGGVIKIVTVKHALLESERNIREKLGQNHLHIFYQLLLEGLPEIQSLAAVSLKDIFYWEHIVPRKDVPILLGALHSKVVFLITLDRRDFLANEKLADLDLPLRIITPGDFIQNHLS